MTTPGRIPIGAARALSREYQCPMVVIFAIHPDQEHFTVTTYGATKGLCKLAASYGDQFADAVLDGTVGAPATEPEALPTTSAVYAGHRKRGAS